MAKKNQKQQAQIDPEYLKAYYDNEANANKNMSYANAFASFLMVVIWILYLTGVFKVSKAVLPLINIIFPIGILILLTPLLYSFFWKDRLRKPGYKYFVLFSFIFVIAILNVILPKHTMIAWALCIIMTNHYYNPKVGITVFSFCIGLCLICLYLAMFFGEYDPNLLGSGIIEDGKIVYVYGVENRYKMLHEMILQGENRYLKTFAYYFIPRAAILTLVFFVSNSLNRRTYKLLVDEINVNSLQQRTKTELEVAKDIQLATLPVQFVTNSNVEIQAELKAAKEVGGDFYDYFALDDDHTAILIGDVSGKGIPAAMFMMKTITCFKNYVSLSRSPSQILDLVNKTIYEGNDSQMFVTCFLAIVSNKTGEVKFANAGHNPPIIGKNGNYRYLKCNNGFILGGFEKAIVKDETFTLDDGEMIMLYTDGITEARNKNGEFFGEKRLLDLLNKKNYSSLLELHHQLKDEILEFESGIEQSDDMTYITLKYHGDQCAYKELKLPAVKENIPKLLKFLENFSTKYEIDKSFVTNLLIIGDELISNVVKYAYPEGETGDIFVRILYNLDNKELVLTIIDEGTPFDPFEVNNKPIEGDITNVREGGLGILIVKRLMSEYAYDRINKKNIITLKKKL